MPRRKTAPSVAQQTKPHVVREPKPDGESEADGDCPVATVEAPMCPHVSEGLFHPRHVDIGALTTIQSNALVALRDGLRKRHAQLASGRHVETCPDAVRWLLEQLSMA